MPIDFRILGPLQTLGNGRSITPKGPKLRILLATLLAHPGRVVPTYRLVEALWGSAPPATAATTLRSHLSRLRLILGDVTGGGRLTAEPFGYVLRIRPEELDLYRFDALARDARQHVVGAEWDAAEVTLRKALALWRGRALEGIGSEWLERVIVPGLEERRMAALEERVDIDLRLGRYHDLVAELAGLVPAYPFRERLHGQLMVALYCTGRQADAFSAFRRLRGLVHDELGVEPTAGIQRLHRAILGGVTEARLLDVLGGIAAPHNARGPL